MQKIKATLFASIAACAALGASVAAGSYAVDLLETRLVAQTRAALAPQDDWLQVSASGLQLTLTGAAPADDARTAALARVAAAGLSAVLLDRTEVAPPNKGTPARQPQADLGVEIVFGPGATTIFGQIPEGADAADPFLELAETLKAAPILSPQRGRVAEAWDDSVALAVRAVGLLERGRVAVTPGRVEIRASAASDAARDAALAALQPGEGIALDAEISAPRRVISPFAFEASLSESGGWRVVRCAAATEEGRDRIIAALGTGAECEVGLGAPSADWAAAVVASLRTLEDLGAGNVEIADTDIALTGVMGQAPEDFAARTGGLADRLPEVFSLSATLPQPEVAVEQDAAPPEAGFRVTRSPEGLVSMSGLLPDPRLRNTVQTYAEALFGLGAVTNETELADSLPAGWTAHVLAGLETFGMLDHGTLELSPGQLRLEGSVSTMRIRDEIERILAGRLPAETRVVLEVDEAPRPEPEAVRTVVPAQLCAEQIALALVRNRIDFPPSESDIDSSSLPVIDRIAGIMGKCPGARFEIGGHTDSQGRESSNMALSQARADAVLTALLARNVDTVFLYARGYGETKPVASNESEEGRAANRRIEFSLVTDQPQPAEDAEAQKAAPDAPPDALEEPDTAADDAAAADDDTTAPETAGADGDTESDTPEGGSPPESDADAGGAEDPARSEDVAPDTAAPAASRAARTSADDLVSPAAGEPGNEAGPPRPRPRPDQLSE